MIHDGAGIMRSMIHHAAGIGRSMIHHAAGIGRISDHDAAEIGRSMIHDAAVIGRSMIHDAAGGSRPTPDEPPHGSINLWDFERLWGTMAAVRGVVARRPRHHPDDATLVAKPHQRPMPGIAGVAPKRRPQDRAKREPRGR